MAVSIPDTISVDELAQLRINDEAGVQGTTAEANVPISNLPLPKELRDEIYSYLLQGENVQYTPVHGIEKVLVLDRQAYGTGPHSVQYKQLGGTAHTYDFQTQLLRLNKEIGGEAAEYLYKMNRFAKVTYGMEGFLDLVHVFGVPTVVDRHLEGFNHGSVELDIMWSGRNPYSALTAAKTRDQGKLLMLTTDVPRLCGALRYLCQYQVPQAVLVHSSPSGEAHMAVSGLARHANIALAARIVSTGKFPLDYNRQAALLHAVGSITGGGYHLTLFGFYDVELTQRTEARSAPRLVWMSALQWDRYETMSRYHREVRDLSLSRRDQAAARLLERLGNLNRNAPALVPFNAAADDAQAAALRRQHLLLIDMRLTFAAIKARLWDLSIAADFAQAAHREVEALTSVSLPQQYMEAAEHLAFITSFAAICRGGTAPLDRIRFAIHLLKKKPGFTEHRAHDLDIMRRAERGNWISISVEGGSACVWPVPIEQLSIFTLPLRTFDGHTRVTGFDRPDGLINWQDKEHLKRLSLNDMATIQQLQRDHGLPISDFA